MGDFLDLAGQGAKLIFHLAEPDFEARRHFRGLRATLLGACFHDRRRRVFATEDIELDILDIVAEPLEPLAQTTQIGVLRQGRGRRQVDRRKCRQ